MDRGIMRTRRILTLNPQGIHAEDSSLRHISAIKSRLRLMQLEFLLYQVIEVTFVAPFGDVTISPSGSDSGADLVKGF